MKPTKRNRMSAKAPPLTPDRGGRRSTDRGERKRDRDRKRYGIPNRKGGGRTPPRPKDTPAIEEAREWLKAILARGERGGGEGTKE